MAYRKVDEASLSAVADSIREKGGTTGALAFPDGFVSAVQAIQAGGGDDGLMPIEKYTYFYDYDGTVLYQYTTAEIQALTELPSLPANVSHEGLVFQGWNWSLEDLKSLNYPMDVGALYDTFDSKGRLYITISSGEDLAITLTMWCNGSAVIDFGDGSDSVSISGVKNTVTTEHTYSTVGDYVISVEHVSGDIIRFGYNDIANFSSALSAKTILTKVEYGPIRTSYSCFYNNTNLKYVVASLNSYSSSGYSFYGCTNLRHFTVTCNDPEIGINSFEGCKNLVSVALANGWTVSTSRSNYFAGCFKLRRVCFGPQVTVLGSSYFKECNNLETVFLSENQKVIGGTYSFANCYRLWHIELPNGMTDIGEYALQNCYTLRLTNIPNSLNYIHNGAFSGCHVIRLTKIPSSVNNIGRYAFENCFNMTTITFEGTPTGTINANAFSGCTNLTTINVPWAEGAVANAPWGATNATINYNYTGE